MPPEYVESGFISNKFDVFSLGTIIIKMMAGSSGYSRCLQMHPEDFIEHVRKLYIFYFNLIEVPIFLFYYM
jgi:hypothetical protein